MNIQDFATLKNVTSDAPRRGINFLQPVRKPSRIVESFFILASGLDFALACLPMRYYPVFYAPPHFRKILISN
jgi:hypothetical protein